MIIKAGGFPPAQSVEKNFIVIKNGVWGEAPMRVVSRWCRCIVKRLCATDCKHPCLVRAAATLSPFPRGRGLGFRQRCRDRTPKGFAGRKANKAYTAFHGGKGVFGKDAEIRTHQALHEAKPSKCPKGDRDREFALFL